MISAHLSPDDMSGEVQFRFDLMTHCRDDDTPPYLTAFDDADISDRGPGRIMTDA
jgi:hypothetical protein